MWIPSSAGTIIGHRMVWGANLHNNICNIYPLSVNHTYNRPPIFVMSLFIFGKVRLDIPCETTSRWWFKLRIQYYLASQ